MKLSCSRNSSRRRLESRVVAFRVIGQRMSSKVAGLIFNFYRFYANSW